MLLLYLACEDAFSFFFMVPSRTLLLKKTNEAALSPNNPTLICNHAAALLSLLRPREAIQDCERALTLDPNFLRAYQRMAKAQLMLGNIDEAKRLIELCVERDPNNGTFKEEVRFSVHALLCWRDVYLHHVAKSGFVRRDDAKANPRGYGATGLLGCTHTYHSHHRVRFSVLMNSFIPFRFAPFSVKLRLVKSEIQLFLKRYPEAASGAADVLREDGNNAEAFYIRGRALYYQSKFDQV